MGQKAWVGKQAKTFPLSERVCIIKLEVDVAVLAPVESQEFLTDEMGFVNTGIPIQD